MQMASNILDKLPVDVIYRIDDDFRIEKTNRYYQMNAKRYKNIGGI